MTDMRHWFSISQDVNDKCWTISVANDHMMYVRGIRDIDVNSMVNMVVPTLRLKDVLYVSKLKRNLVSTSRLTENRVAIVHVRNKCKMISKDGHGHFVMTDQKAGGLWQLNIKTFRYQSSAHMAVSAPHAPSTGGHTRVTKTLMRRHAMSIFKPSRR